MEEKLLPQSNLKLLLKKSVNHRRPNATITATNAFPRILRRRHLMMLFIRVVDLGLEVKHLVSALEYSKSMACSWPSEFVAGRD